MVERTTTVARSASTVSVACKLPNGLILQLYEMVNDREQVMGGDPRTIKVARKKGDPVKLRPCTLPFGVAPQHPYPGGYSITSVPRDFWEEWLKQNADSDIVKNRIVFSEGTAESTSQRAREQARERSSEAPKGVKSGLEALDPKNLPKVGMGLKIESYKADDASAD